MARAVAEGASKVDGAEVALSVYRKPCRRNYLKKQAVKANCTGCNPARTGRLRRHYFCTPTRFGNMSGQMRTFLDQTAACGLPAHYTENWRASLVPPYWRRSGTNHHIHLDDPCASRMVIVPIGYAAQELFDVSQVPAVRRTAQPPSQAVTVHASPPGRTVYCSLSRGICRRSGS